MIKVALAMIVRGSKDEAEAFDRCLDNVLSFVDKAFITITHKKGEKRNKEVESICKRWNEPDFEIKNGKKKFFSDPDKVVISDFEWIDDFAAARNFNFSQVPEEHTHILWCDADDVFRGLERLKEILIKDNQKDRPADGFGIWYLYHFDEYKQPDVVHKKTMLVRNPKGNEWVSWRGELHEELVANTNSPDITMIDKFFNGGIDRMHMTDIERDTHKTQRNIRISRSSIEKNPLEPRNYRNLAESLHGAGEHKESLKIYNKFLDLSGSEEEKFLAHMRISTSYDMLKDRENALLHAYLALGMRPEYPDGYFNLGQLMYRYQRLDDAEKYYLMGLSMRPKYDSVIVYNPRDYDYNPMRMLIHLYEDKGRPDLGIPFMEACLKIYPNNPQLKSEYELLKNETKRLTEVVSHFKEYEQMDDETFKRSINELPEDIRSHPGICSLYNQRFVKKESNGKELSIYCYPTAFDFNPELFEKVGFGGSEEAVVNLSKSLAELGWEVTVYNRCGPTPKKHGKVWWKPFWMWNHRDVVDRLIIWRSPKPLDFDLGAKKVYLDLHDVVPEEEFTPARLKKVDGIFVKTNAHRVLFPKVPDDKINVIPNGQDNSLFTGKVKKDPYLIINTSSPDRSMDALPELFERVKALVPEAKLKWAYGWKNFDDLFNGDPLRQKWKKEIEGNIRHAQIESLGKLPQKDVALLYEEASVLAYPSEFYEIDCISVKKAQAAGCVPITTDFAAFKESVQFGVKIPSKKKIGTWSKPYQMGYGITDEKQKQAWVDAVVAYLKTPPEERPDTKVMWEWAQNFNWDSIAKRWDEKLK